MERLIKLFTDITNTLHESHIVKAFKLASSIPGKCQIDYQSKINKVRRDSNPKKHHPIRPVRGEIYNALLWENIGSELCGNHLVIIIQNDKGNIFSEKVNVIAIEGDGNKINETYHARLCNKDLIFGALDKDPSRVVITEIMTLDKARLERKIGKINPEKIKEISRKIKRQLEL